MSKTDGLADTLRRLALGAVENGSPVRLCFGTVSRTEPLCITTEQGLELGAAFLVLTETVQPLHAELDWEQDCGETALHVTTEQGTQSLTHGHGLRVHRRVTIREGLRAGERVLLAQMQGGQKYVVWDRVRE